jgi:hypothetical protein
VGGGSGPNVSHGDSIKKSRLCRFLKIGTCKDMSTADYHVKKGYRRCLTANLIPEVELIMVDLNWEKNLL